MDIEINEENIRDIISSSQIFIIRQQILAYKHVIKNLPIPKDIEKNIVQMSKEQWEIEKEKVLQRTIKFHKDKIEKNPEIISFLETDLQKNVDDKLDEFNNLMKSKSEKYNFLKNFQSNEYENRLSLVSDLLEKNVIDDDFNLKLDNEKKFLSNYDFYSDTKEKILSLIDKDNEIPFKIWERVTFNLDFYKREKPSKKSEAKLVEKFELQIKNEQEQRKKIRHLEFITGLFNHQQEFNEFHRKKYRISKKRTNHARNFVENFERKDQDLKDRQEKERVKALKENDFDAYINLVQKTKNTRILELLNHTDSFLKAIGAKVLLQKGKNRDFSNDDDNIKVIGSNSDMENLKNSNKVYYNLTHTTKEEINVQPSLLEGGALKSYQLIGLEWLVSLYNNKLNGVLADEMGLGKTIQTISLFCYLIEFKKNFGPFLIVVPLTTLSNWTYEFDKWAPSIKKIIYKGTPPHRKTVASSLKTTTWNVCITTYEYILKDRLVLNKFEWKYIVVDEGHRMKNARSKFAQTLGQKYVSDHRLLLTGTPLQNNLAELWSLLNFLLPKVFSSCDDFEKWFNMPLSKISTDKEVQLTEEERLLIINRLHQVLRPFLLRRVKKEVESEIPNKVEHVIKIELSSWQKIVYTQIKDNAVLSRDPTTGKIGTRALMNLMMQLRKICNHPYLFLQHDEFENLDDNVYRVSGKFELLDRIIPKIIITKHRILMFCQMTNLMNIMQMYFEYRKYKYLRLDGNTKADERCERMALFNQEKSEYDIFLLSTRAGGLGLNLQTADTVILFDSDWNPQMDLQAQDRAHRIGQKSEVRVLRLVTNSWIEEEILSKAAFKMNLDEIFIQAGLYNQKSTDTERRERLQDLLKKKNIYEELDDEIPNDEQINEMIARNEEELSLFDQMDKDRYEEEKKIYKNFKEPQIGDSKFFNYRLIGEDEIPEWIKAKPTDEGINIEYGRGNRSRKQISYTDDFDDNQWLDEMEQKVNENSLDSIKIQEEEEEQEKEREKEKEEENFNPNYQYH